MQGSPAGLEEGVGGVSVKPWGHAGAYSLTLLQGDSALMRTTRWGQP